MGVFGWRLLVVCCGLHGLTLQGVEISVLEAAAIAEVGATVERIVAVIDRQEGARQTIEAAGYEFHSLLTTADIRART